MEWPNGGHLLVLLVLKSGLILSKLLAILTLSLASFEEARSSSLSARLSLLVLLVLKKPQPRSRCRTSLLVLLVLKLYIIASPLPRASLSLASFEAEIFEGVRDRIS